MVTKAPQKTPVVTPTTVPTAGPTLSPTPTPVPTLAPTETPDDPAVTPAQTYAASYKGMTANNPLLANSFACDPAAIEYNGRVYVCKHDLYIEFDGSVLDFESWQFTK